MNLTAAGEDDIINISSVDEPYAGTVFVEDIYAPKVAAFLSILGSFVIIREITSDMREKKATALSRMLLSMSIGDLMFSGAWFLTTWASPRELDYLRDTNYGTTGTCTAQGFFMEFGGIASLLFNASLAVFYLLIVKYSYREHQMQRLEKWVQPGLWGAALIFATIPLPLQMYNNTHLTCWLRSYPIDCHESWFVPPGETPNCTRGDNSMLGVVLLFMAPAWICVIVAGTIMVLIFRTIRRIELRMESRYGSSAFLGTENRNPSSNFFRTQQSFMSDQQQTVIRRRKKSRKVAIQGMWYMTGFLLTFFLTTISVIYFLATGKWNRVLDTISYIFMAMQGVWNLMNFSRKRDMVTREGRLARCLIWETCCCGCGISMIRRIRNDRMNTQGFSEENDNQNILCTQHEGDENEEVINDNHSNEVAKISGVDTSESISGQQILTGLPSKTSNDLPSQSADPNSSEEANTDSRV